MTLTIDHPKPKKAEAPTYCMPPAERMALQMILRERMTEMGRTGRKESFGRFLGRINNLRVGRLSPSAIKSFMMRDNTRLSTLDRLADAFEIEGGHEALIELARERAYDEGFYKNPQHQTRTQKYRAMQQLALFGEES